jgi:hypothetical protein
MMEKISDDILRVRFYRNLCNHGSRMDGFGRSNTDMVNCLCASQQRSFTCKI